MTKRSLSCLFNFIDTVNLVTSYDSLPVHERISEVFQYYTREGKACPLPGQTAYTSIILPRSSYLKFVDPDGKMTCEELKIATEKDIDMFCAMMDCPSAFETAYPDVPYDEYLRLHDSFVLCEPIPKRWGRWGVWKCGCDDAFAGALCGHGMLLSMVFDKTITFPQSTLPGRFLNGTERAGVQVHGSQSKRMTRKIQRHVSIGVQLPWRRTKPLSCQR